MVQADIWLLVYSYISPMEWYKLLYLFRHVSLAHIVQHLPQHVQHLMNTMQNIPCFSNEKNICIRAHVAQYAIEKLNFSGSIRYRQDRGSHKDIPHYRIPNCFELLQIKHDDDFRIMHQYVIGNKTYPICVQGANSKTIIDSHSFKDRIYAKYYYTQQEVTCKWVLFPQVPLSQTAYSAHVYAFYFYGPCIRSNRYVLRATNNQNPFLVESKRYDEHALVKFLHCAILLYVLCLIAYLVPFPWLATVLASICMFFLLSDYQTTVWLVALWIAMQVFANSQLYMFAPFVISMIRYMTANVKYMWYNNDPERIYLQVY